MYFQYIINYTQSFSDINRFFGNQKKEVNKNELLTNKDLRLAYLASAIPDCMRILIFYIITIYK